MRFSAWLTEKESLPPGLGSKIFSGLIQADPNFVARMEVVMDRLTRDAVPLDRVFSYVREQLPDYADVHESILTAWYMGVVGVKEEAYAVAYEEALMYAPVADFIVIPSYAGGLPGYWTAPPRAVAQAEEAR